MTAKLASIILVLFAMSVSCVLAAAEDTGVPKEWQSLDLPGLTSLAKQLEARGDLAVSERRALAKHLAARYTADAVAGKAGSDAWLDLVAAAGSYFPDETQEAVAKDILTNLVPGDKASIVALTDGRIVRIGSALAKVKRRPEACALCATWISGSDKYASTSIINLYTLGFLVRLSGKESAAARERLAAHVAARYLPGKAVTHEVGCFPWHELCVHIGSFQPVEAKADWAKKLREAFVPDGQAAQALKAEEFVYLAQALDWVSDRQVPGTVVIWAEGGGRWQDLKPDLFCWVVQNVVKAGDAGKAPRGRLAEHVVKAYLSGATPTQAVGCSVWKDLAKALAGDFPAATRQAWAAKLRAGYAEGSVLSSLPIEAVRDLVDALTALGDKGAAGQFETWAAGTTSWQTLKPAGLASFAENLAKGGDGCKPTRARLAGHISQKYLPGLAEARSVTCGQWKSLAQSLGKDLTGEARQTWTDRLRAAYAEPKVLASMKVADTGDLVAALDALGDKQAHGVLAGWTEGTRQWQAFTAADLVSLAKGLAPAAESGKAARMLLLEHVTAKYLSDPLAARSVSCEQWKSLALSLGKDLAPEKSARWTAQLASAFVDHPETLRGLRFAEFMDMAGAMKTLGGTARVSEAVVKALAARSWQPAELLPVAELLASCGEAGRPGRQSLVAHLAARYFVNKTAARSVPCAEWHGLVKCLLAELSPETRKTWASQLRSAFAETPQILRGLKAPEFRSLVEALGALGDGNASSLVSAWASP